MNIPEEPPGGFPTEARSFDREILVPFFEFYEPLETFLGWTTLLKIHTGFFIGSFIRAPM